MDTIDVGTLVPALWQRDLVCSPCLLLGSYRIFSENKLVASKPDITRPKPGHRKSTFPVEIEDFVRRRIFVRVPADPINNVVPFGHSTRPRILGV